MEGLVGAIPVEQDTTPRSSCTYKGLTRLVSVSGSIAVLLLSGLGLSTSFSQEHDISGRIISAETSAPIEGALVYVYSATADEDEGLNQYTRTDAKGYFKAKARGTVSVRVWMPGYALRGVSAGSVSEASRREILIELRPLTHTNWVKEHDEFLKLKYGGGFSFTLGKAVDGDSADADFVLMQDVNDATNAYIEARGEGGLTFQRWDEKVDFDNSPSAPLTGYERNQKLVRPQSGFYYLRTRDGKHYAKFRLLIDIAELPDGSRHLDLGESRIIWAYQPDGTRNLEIAPSRKLSFPVEEFGIKRESLPAQ